MRTEISEKMKTKELEFKRRKQALKDGYNLRTDEMLGLIDERIKDYKLKLEKIKGYSSYYERHRRMLHNKISELEELKARINGK